MARPVAAGRSEAAAAAAEARLRQGSVRAQLSRDDIAGLLAGFSDYLIVLRDAAPADKAALYGHIGLKLTYHPAAHTVRAEAQPRPYPSEIGSCPGGDSTDNPTPCDLDR